MVRKNSRPQTPAVCPVCGEDVPPRALACPECGADHRSGWKIGAYENDALDLPDDELHQRGLPRAVAPEQAEAFARVNLEVDVVEDGRATEGLRDIEKAEKRHGKGRT